MAIYNRYEQVRLLTGVNCNHATIFLLIVDLSSVALSINRGVRATTLCMNHTTKKKNDPYTRRVPAVVPCGIIAITCASLSRGRSAERAVEASSSAVATLLPSRRDTSRSSPIAWTSTRACLNWAQRTTASCTTQNTARDYVTIPVYTRAVCMRRSR